MMRMQKTLLGAGGLALSLLASSVMAQTLSQSEIDQLGNNLTPVGAERAGNAAGTIPEWTGGLGPDAGRVVENNFQTNPFAGEQPQFVITAQNYQQYRENLTPGQIALFERYPETFRMPVYETKRTVGYPQYVYDQVKRTAGQAKLVNNGDGIENFSHGSFAFPIPKSGAEVVWNHNTRYRINTKRWYMQAMPQTNGSYTLIKMEEEVGYPQYMPDVDASTMPNTLLFFKQRRQRATLRCAFMPLHDHSAVHDPRIQVGAYQPDNPCVIHALAQAVYQDVMVDPIEELLQVHVHHDTATGLHSPLGGQDRILRSAPRSETVAVLTEGRIKQRLQHLQQRLLDQPIRHRGDAQLALATVRFRDHYPAYRTRPVYP